MVPMMPKLYINGGFHESKDFLDAKADDFEAQGKPIRMIAKHLNDFEGLIVQLSVAGLSLDDETQACLLLYSLLENWNTLVVFLGNSAPEGKVTLAMVINSLFNEEIRMKDFVGNDTLSRRTRVEAKVEDHLSITIQEADPILEGKYGKIGHMRRNC